MTDEYSVEQVLENLCPTTFKVSHNTRPDAEVQRKKTQTKGLEVYSCRDCSGWHVGHPKRKRRRIKVRR